MRKVTMVVPVLIMSCQVSEKWKVGPVTPQTTMMRMARAKTQALPSTAEERRAMFRHQVGGDHRAVRQGDADPADVAIRRQCEKTVVLAEAAMQAVQAGAFRFAGRGRTARRQLFEAELRECARDIRRQPQLARRRGGRFARDLPGQGNRRARPRQRHDRRVGRNART